MPRDTYVEITVDDSGLLPQILRELLELSADPNFIDVTDGEDGRIILAHPELAELWYQKATAPETTEETQEPQEPAEDPEPSDEAEEPAPPAKRGPGRPRKAAVSTSASNGEEPA